ncbi:Hint domain-containing protein [Sphingomonas aquatilis]
MGKVLKAVAIIAVAVAVAYFAPQISAALVSAGLSTATAAAITTTLVSTAIAAAVTTGISLLAGKPSTGGASPSVFRQSISNSFIIYGKRRVGGLLIFFHPIGKDWRYFVIAVAGHRCKGVVRWWLNDEEVTVDGAGKVTSGKYANNAWLWFYRGTDDQAAHPTFVAETQGKWSANHRGRGTALIYAKFKMTDDVVQSGMPNITAEVEGKDDVLDPRTGVRGYTRNAALIFYDWLAMAREEGGFGAYDDEIDWDWVAAQAGVADEFVDTPDGPERRYEFDSYIQTGAAPSEVRDTFVTCCAGAFTYSGGKMLMRPGYYVPPSAQLKEQDLAGPITVPALLAGDQMSNEVTGTYIEPDKYQPGDVPTRSLYSTDVRQASFDLPHITSIYRGQRLLEIFLRKAQAERRCSWPMNIMGIAISTLDTVQLGTARYGLSNYAFQVVNWGLNQDFSVGLQLEETSPEIYEFTPDMYLEPGEVGELTPAEPIGDEVTGVVASLIQNSAPIDQGFITSNDNADGTAKITIAAHTRRYADKDVAVAGGVINALTNATYYDIFYDDPSRAGGAVTYAATTNPPDGRLSAAHPARHYVGFVTTAAAGGQSTGGGGATPPGGGYCVTALSLVMMADGSWKRAGDMKVGDRIRTRHENTLEWGEFTVTAVNIVTERIMRAHGYPDATAEHRFWTRRKGWHRMSEIGVPAGAEDVVRLTVPGAATYVARHPSSAHGILSHNIKQQEQVAS